MSLLNKASILTTPTSYENGKILSVKPVQSLSEELITNGDFATDSDWVKNGGATISSGQANIIGDGTSFTSIVQYSIFTIGKKYKVSVDVTINSGLGLKFQDSGNNENIGFATTSGTYVFYFTGTSNANLVIGRRAGGTAFNSSVDNVSVKEVIDADFDFTRNSSATRVNSQGLIEDVQILSSNLVSNGDFSQEGSEKITNGDFSNGSTDWSNPDNAATFSNDSVTISGGSGNRRIAQANVTSPTSAQWKLQYEITEKVGSSDLKLYTTNSGTAEYTVVPSAVGVHTFYFNSNLSTFYFNFSNSTGSITIDNVSVKEVGQDWVLGTDWSIGNNKAIFDGTASYIQQNNLGASGVNAIYKVKWTQNITAGTRLRFFARNYNDSGNETILSGSTTGEGSFGLNGNCVGSGTFTAFVSSTNGCSFKMLGETGVNADITNISVIEITDDTNLPRIDYTDGVGSWLFEPQSTNTATYSNDFTQGVLFNGSSNPSLTSSVLSANQSTSPDGTNTANKLTDNNDGGTGSITLNYNGTTFTSGEASTVSMFVKKDTVRYFRIAIVNLDTDVVTSFDLDTGLVNDGTGVMTDYGEGWYRCSVTTTTTTDLTGSVSFAISENSDRSGGNLRNGTKSTFLWGLQAEEQSFMTSYIPTNGSQITRLADAASGAGSSDLINSTEGVLYAEIKALADDGTNRIISLFKDGDNSNRINIFYTSGSNKMKFIVRINNTNVFNTSITLSDIANYNKVALSFKENEFKVYINGVKEAEQLSGSIYPINTLDKLNFDQSGGNLPFYGKTKCLAVFKEALTDAELTCLTTI